MRIINFLFFLIAFSGCNETPEKTETSFFEDGIFIGKNFSIKSKILNQQREYIVYFPESYYDEKRKREKYPVVFLLDAAYSFLPFIGMLKQYSELNDTKILPEMIVVGIKNIDNSSRMMDFSPTTDGQPDRFGGGEKFLNFVEEELFPIVEKKFSGSKNRTIVGHSFGGLVVMNALVSRPEMFDNYLMIDGSLYFDNELFLKNEKYSLKGKMLKNKNLFIGIANTAVYGSTLSTIKTDTISANKYVRYSLNLINEIGALDTDLNMKWKYYENDTHGSSSFLAQKDGFRFFYSWFAFDKQFKYNSKYFRPETEADKFVNLTKSHFDTISKKIGYTFRPEKNEISSNANMLLNWHKQPDQAKEMLELNIKYYPKDPSVYKDLSDFYISQSDTLNARIYNKKSLELEHAYK